jgi:hypothetical protein
MYQELRCSRSRRADRNQPVTIKLTMEMAQWADSTDFLGAQKLRRAVVEALP